MRLVQILSAAGVASLLPIASDTRDLDIAGVATDSRTVNRGDLFCCVRGERVDGHDHAAAAIVAGARAIVVDHPIEVVAPQIVVDDVRAVVGPLAAAALGNPSQALRVVGVTGTNGKTTVTHLVDAIVRSGGIRSGIVGTVGTTIADEILVTSHTTPDAVELQRLLAQMRDADVDVVSMEVSSHALDQSRVLGVDFAVACFTNLRSDHLDYHGTIDEYAAAKRRLFDPRTAPVAVINADDPWGRRFAEDARRVGSEVITYSLGDERATLRAEAIVESVHGTVFRVVDARAQIPMEIETPLVGRFNVSNVLAAVGCARALGIDTDTIVRGLAAVPQVPGRLERIEPAGGRIVVVDYAHTADALAAVLDALRPYVGDGGRLAVLFGCGGDRDRTKRPEMGAVVAARADLAVLTSDNPRSEDPAAIVADVVRGMPADDRPHVELDRHRAIEWIIDATGPGDVVVIAGKGHETGQTTGTTTVEFDDRVVTRSVLAGRGAS